MTYTATFHFDPGLPKQHLLGSLSTHVLFVVLADAGRRKVAPRV